MKEHENILSALKKAGKAMKSGEISDATGITKATVDKGLKELVKTGKVNSPKRCYYGLIK